ncbi:Hypothetical protein PHPALM_8089 [Phytophthora palmivora]|uniref:E3 ubiquitin-protein ligase n=1 Tax=Phytophthora palmivora TaxID=4796 RepID=A0A2P4YAR9_9STRA|nr:Hypothetical protein PHPALM_8089 [Phytophthora palmivora]
MHRVIAETILNSSYMASILFVIFENYKRKLVSQDQNQQVDSEDQDSSGSVTNENLLLAALHCLYVAVEMLSCDIQDQPMQTPGKPIDMGGKQNLDNIARYFDEESSVYVKLCTEIQLEETAIRHAGSNGQDAAASSLLSLLLFFTEHESVMEDVQPVVKLILQSVREKSSTCSQYLNIKKHSQLEAQRNYTNVENDCSNPASFRKDDSDENCDEKPKPTAKEMMRRRQQQILEKMRSQQMQFLCANGDAMKDEANTRYVTEGPEMVETDTDTYDNAMESEEDMEEEHEEEEDEWGFPTGQETASKTKYSKLVNHC